MTAIQATTIAATRTAFQVSDTMPLPNDSASGVCTPSG